jgi:hypothetical protein
LNPRVRIAIQIAGFAVCLGLLGWCLSLALTPENRQQLERLREASALQIAGLLFLSFVTLNLNGLIFWTVLTPVKRVGIVDMLATNGIATFMTYLPFKLSALVRILIHNRRDRVPVLTIGAWFAALTVLLLMTLGPAAAAAAWRQKIDLVWLLATLGGQAVLGTILVITARAFRGEAGQQRLMAIASLVRLGILRRLLASRAWSSLHAGFDMLACPKVVIGATLLRLADLAALSGRFALAAAIFGIALPLDQALLISLSHFMIGVLSPFGVLGAREAGATGVASFLAIGTEGEAAGAFAAVALLVGATEVMVYLVGAGLGLAWLRPDRLLRRRAPLAESAVGQPAGAESAATEPLPTVATGAREGRAAD